MGTKKRKCRDQEEATEEDDCFEMQQKVVNMLREKVYRLEEELNYLRSHQSLLLKAWSMPVYPPEYVPGSWNLSRARPQDGQTDIFDRAGTGQSGGDQETAKKAKKRKTQKTRTSTPVSSPEREAPPVQVIVDDTDASDDSKETSSESGDDNRAKKGSGKAKKRMSKKKAKIPTPVSSPGRVAPPVQEIEDVSSDDSYASSDDSKSGDEKGSPVVETVSTESAARSGSASSEDSSSDEEPEKEKSSESDSESENSSDSEDEKTPETPAIGETKTQAKFPKVNWANEPGRRKPGRDSSSSGSDSNDSDDSVSVVEIADEGVTSQRKGKEKELQKDEVKDATNKDHSAKRNKKKKEDTPKKASEDSEKHGEAKLKKKERASATSAEPSTTSRRDKLSQDATPEEIFDWNVLGTQGPWTQPEPINFTHWHGSTEDSGQWVKQLISLPFSYSSCEEYISRNQWLIFEECKAMLNSSWEIMEKNDDSVAQSTVGSDGTEDSLENHKFRLRPMHRCADDSFNYFELEALDGRRFQLDTSEVLLLSFPKLPNMKVLALASTRGDHAGLPALLKTRVELQSSTIQCKLARLSNLVTLKRQFVALVSVSKIWHSLRQPLLDPLRNNGCSISPPSDDSLDEHVRLPEDMSTTLSTWKEHGIFNNRQLLTMAALMQMKQGILLVQGPPGTGKTSTIVGMISALCLEEPGVKILVCASSNAAVDEIVYRLKDGMVDGTGKLFSPELGKLIRLGQQKSIQPACHDVTMDTLLAKSPKDSRATSAEMISNATIVCSTLSGSGHSVFDESKQKFDVLVIDEAAQALECEALIALHRARGRCVIVGDPCQLSATVIQRPGTAYGRSLFERMQGGGMKTFLMTTQYRMHPQISRYPSARFYRGCLRDSKSTQQMPSIFRKDAYEMGIRCDGYHFRLGPYCFLDVSWGTEEIEATGHSLSNVEEATVVATVVHGVVKSLEGGRKADIGVITPYLAQRSTILSILSKYNIDDSVCEVNTVDGFQGREKDVIVLSCVRAVTDRGLGFVSDEKRMNVALTRAKHALIIVGHGKTLKSQSASWNSLLQDATARGCYQVLRESHRERKGSGRPSPVGERPPAASEKAARFHSAQTSPVKKRPQLRSNPVPTPMKVEQETCSFAHHVPGCGHSHKQNHTGRRQTVEPMKKMRGALRVDRPTQHRRGGGNGRGGRRKSANGVIFPDNTPAVVPSPNQHIYFGHAPGEQQQGFPAPNPCYYGRQFEESFEQYAAQGGGAHGGWTRRGPVDQGRPYMNNTHANRGRR